MIVRVESLLECEPQLVWEEVQKVSLLLKVAKPMVILIPGNDLDSDCWQQGRTYFFKSLLHGFIPMGIRRLFMERIDTRLHEIQTREQDWLISKWDHLISVIPEEPGFTRFRDEIEIEAGIFTPLVWAWATLFYRHRQRRWRHIARALAVARKTPPSSLG